jgi:hypothetical protein
MSHSYGTILSSTPDSITRLVVRDGSVQLQTLTIAQEVTLTTPEVTAMFTVLATGQALRPPARHWPALGSLCACEAQPGRHAADRACSPFLRESGEPDRPGPQEQQEARDGHAR